MSGADFVAGEGDESDAGAEDVLFEDRMQGVEASESFPAGPEFDENAVSDWTGDSLEFDEPEVDSDAGVPDDGEVDVEAMHAAQASFRAELDSLLQSEDELELDSEGELEIVGSDAGEGEGEGEGEGGPETFVISDADSQLQAIEAAGLEAGEDGVLDEEEAPASEAAELEPVDYFGNVTGDGDEAEVVEAGWEPLSSAEPDGVSDHEDAAVEEAGQAAAGWREGGVGAGDHDIYADFDDEPEVVGTRSTKRRTLSMFGALAAALLVLSTAVLTVWRPQWLGLAPSVESVESVQVERPEVRVEVAEPPMPAADVPVTQPDQPRVVVGEPPVVEPEPLRVEKSPAVAVEPQPGKEAQPGENVEPQPDAVESKPGDPQWPVVEADPVAVESDEKEAELLRAGANLLVGAVEEMPQQEGVDGIQPGARAFAQLENGNYFIGSIKAVNASFVTLRLKQGEISLDRKSIARFAELGSADYDALQKMTSGFVRLTNNNRLVGGILQSIADDHVVLETRSNRVMLPKSAVEEIVPVNSEVGVRIGTTQEEDEWLRKLSDQQLRGAKSGAAEPKPTPTGSGRGR